MSNTTQITSTTGNSTTPTQPVSYTTTTGTNNQMHIQTYEVKATDDKVAYETYQKVLAERKRDQERARELQAKLDEIELAKRQFEEETLKKKEDYKTLLENKAREHDLLASELNQMKEQRKQAMKLNAFLEGCGNNQIKKNYWKMIPVGDIIINPETGEVDPLSVKMAVDSYIRDYPETLEKSVVGMPSASPSVAVNGITYEQWLQLPADQMKLRRKDIINK